MKNLVSILKTLEDPEDNLLDLLEAICESNPSPDGGEWLTAVRMGCPRHPDPDYHVVSLAGFILLEEVETAFGTTVQTLEMMGSDGIDPFNSNSLVVLASRLARQKEKMTFLKINVEISSEKDAEYFKAVMQGLQACPMESIYIGGLEVEHKIGARGWQLVAESVQLHPGVVCRVETSKEAWTV